MPTLQHTRGCQIPITSSTAQQPSPTTEFDHRKSSTHGCQPPLTVVFAGPVRDVGPGTGGGGELWDLASSKSIMRTSASGDETEDGGIGPVGEGMHERAVVLVVGLGDGLEDWGWR
jgi:hypothetical protein